MARIAKPAIPLAAYRRFAIITVGVTALLALFASGNSREAIADELAQQQREAELQRISAERTSKPVIGRRDPDQQARYSDSDTTDFGAPMMSVAGSGGSSSTLESFTTGGGAARRGTQVVIPGYSQTYLNSLSEDEYQRLLRNVRAAGLLDQAERRRTLDNLENMSRSRAGQATGIDALVN
jgi:hypothetical protein